MLGKGLNKYLQINKKDLENKKIAIVRTDYFNQMIDSLENKCSQTLIQNGLKQENIEVFTVPGSWEIPILTSKLAESRKFDAIITFGIIIKGDTYHFESIANETARALMDISISTKVPVIFEILAVYNIEQAEIRTGDDENNKGIEAALAAIKIIKLLSQI
jgi:6,7-dimethyl-8-ribityllumazine synthase